MFILCEVEIFNKSIRGMVEVQFTVGETFSSLADLEQKLKKFSETNFVDLIIAEIRERSQEL